MAAEALNAEIGRTGTIPLVYAAATFDRFYLNLGDALSPLMVSLIAGKPCRSAPFSATFPRMSSVGTIGQGLTGGDIDVWGTGHSGGAPARPRAGTRLQVHATRGPLSQRDFGADDRVIAHGDPVWLLPRFYRPVVPKRWKLGVVMHLSDLADRQFVAAANPKLLRYQLAPGEERDVRLITMVTEVGVAPLRAKLDEILSCERIVSNSLHGLVIAEAYRIPCLYFSPNGPRLRGPALLDIEPGMTLDRRFIDLWLGQGQTRKHVYVQQKMLRTDWENVVTSIDRLYKPTMFDVDPLVEAFPLARDPVTAPADGTVFDHPALADTVLFPDRPLPPPLFRALARGLRRIRPPRTPA